MTTPLPDVSDIEQQTIKRVTRRMIPFLVLLFVVAFLDRNNVGFAALRMNEDIGISQTIYGLGAGIFFLGYFMFEVPSNILLHRYGARVWIARIMVTWGIIAGAMGFLQTPVHFVSLRVLLGIAEAGFFPGVIYLLSLWFPSRYRARMIASFYLGVPIAQIIGAPLSVGLMEMGDAWGFVGWRLMYIVEAVPAVILGVVCYFYLTDHPADAHWLTDKQRSWLINTLAQEERNKPLVVGVQPTKGQMIRKALCNRQVWLLALVYFGITSGSNAMNFFMPTVLASFRGTFGLEIGLMQNGLITAIPYAVAAVAMIWWSRRSDRLQERPRPVRHRPRPHHRHPLRGSRCGDDLVEPSFGSPAGTSLACRWCRHARGGVDCRGTVAQPAVDHRDRLHSAGNGRVQRDQRVLGRPRASADRRRRGRGHWPDQLHRQPQRLYRPLPDRLPVHRDRQLHPGLYGDCCTGRPGWSGHGADAAQ